MQRTNRRMRIKHSLSGGGGERLRRGVESRGGRGEEGRGEGECEDGSKPVGMRNK